MEYSTLLRKKDGGWQYVITYKCNGKWKTKSKQGFKGKHGKAEANEAMLQMIPILRKQVAEGSVSDKVTLKKFYDMYIEHLKLYRQHNTIVKYESSYKHFSSLENKEINKIISMDIQKCVDKMVLSGLKPSTVEIYYNTFMSVLKACKEEYKLLIDVPSIKLKLKNNETDKKALTIEEKEIILKDFEKSKYYLIILFALECGLRVGEILGLTWNDINLNNKTVSINKQWKKVKGEWDFGDLKSKASKRLIPLSPKLVIELSKLDLIDTARLFPNKSTSGIIVNVDNRLKKYGVSLHELRHTYCTHLLLNGLDVGTTAKLMGHDPSITMHIYNHIQDTHLERAGELIDKIF